MKKNSLLRLLFLLLMNFACTSRDKTASSSFKLSGSFNALNSQLSESMAPQMVSAKVYEWWGSTQSTCQNPVLLTQSSFPSYIDFVTQPTVETGQIPHGNYACFIGVLSNMIQFRFEKEGPLKACQPHQTFTTTLCGADKTSLLPNGTSGKKVACQDHQETKIALYFSTQAPPVTYPMDFLNPPSSEQDRMHATHLSFAPHVSSNTSSVLVIQATAVEVKNKCDLILRFESNTVSF